MGLEKHNSRLVESGQIDEDSDENTIYSTARIEKIVQAIRSTNKHFQRLLNSTSDSFDFQELPSFRPL